MQEALKNIPSVQRLKKRLPQDLHVANIWVHMAINDVLGTVRDDVKAGGQVPAIEQLVSIVVAQARSRSHTSLRPVINASGVVIHTNLGRSPLPEEMLAHVMTVSTGYSTLEYQLDTGRRGLRHDHIGNVLKELLNAEDAMVVNNNAAAVLLALSSLAQGKDVVVSRGELVEIGGAFRIPDVMALSGATLREVGTTNKTHLRDYEKAITDNTALFLKVHQSNFRMVGFTEMVDTAELVALAKARGLGVMEDLGSGVLSPFHVDGHDEPSVRDVLKTGVDLVTFSGDKLLGGPQAGVIVGRREWVQAMKRHPLARAVRVDKMTLAALEMTVRWYLEGRGDELPLWQMINAPLEVLEKRAKHIARRLSHYSERTAAIDVAPDVSEIGGGSMPGTSLPTYVVRLVASASDIVAVERRLREASVPVIARMAHGAILFDVRTIFSHQEDGLVAAIKWALSSIKREEPINEEDSRHGQASS